MAKNKKLKPVLWYLAFLIVTAIFSLVLSITVFREKASAPQSPSQLPYKVNTNIEVTGKIKCLKHSDQNGPQTEECAIGLLANDGKYYALNNGEKVIGIPAEQTVKIKGIYHDNPDTKYIQSGTIEVVSLSIHYDVPDNFNL